MNEREKDVIKASRIAKEKAEEILEEMDICDKEHPNYFAYKIRLESGIFSVMHKILKL